MPSVVALGGGAVGTDQVRGLLRERAFTLFAGRLGRHGLAALAHERSAAGPGRGALSRALRRAGAALSRVRGRAREHRRGRGARGRRRPRRGRLARAARRARPGDGPVEIVADARVAGIYGMEAQLALGGRLRATHELPPGEEAKTIGAVDRLWRELRLDRGGVDRRARRGLHDGHGGLRGGHVHARDRLGRRPDDARRPGRRRDRRQDGDRPPRWQEPRRRLPLARPHGRRPGAPRDPARGRAPERPGRAREDRPARGRTALGAAVAARRFAAAPPSRPRSASAIPTTAATDAS